MWLAQAAELQMMARQLVDVAAPARATARAPDSGAAAAVEQALQQVSGLGDAGDHDSALALLALALRDHGEHADLCTAQGWALENTTPPRWADARAAYQQALAVDAGHVWARIGLATTLTALGDAGAARPLYQTAAEQALARAPRQPELLEALGWCQYRLGRLDDAAATFERALGTDPAWVAVLFDLGLVALARGDERAAAYYQAAIDVLAQRSPAQRAGALRVAVDDVDEAIGRDASCVFKAQALAVRDRLALSLQAAGTS